MFSVAIKKAPFFINSKVSKLKVEKVLKPPQNPMISKGFTNSEKLNLPEKKYIVKPKIKVAKKLESKVERGKFSLTKSLNNKDIPILQMLPKPLPTKTKNH